jgi:DNA-binding CsgD family transcriptional regulator
MRVRPASLARGRVKALCRRGLDADAFRRGLRTPLRDVIAFDAYCMNTADPATLEVTSSVGDGLTGAEAARLFAIEHAGQDVHPLRELARAACPVATIGDRPERSERMRELFLPRGWRDELRAALVERGRCWGYLHLFRATPFTRSDVAAVVHLVPSLAFALREAVRRSPPRAARAAPGVVVVGAGGEVRAATRAGARMLASIPRDPSLGGPPHAIVAAAAGALAADAVREVTVMTPGGVLRIAASAEGSVAVLMLDGARHRDVTSLVLAAHRLSPREEEVCGAMLRGSTDDEIGLALGIGTQTAKTHAKSAFAKLGVRGRGGLLSLVDGLDGLERRPAE